MEIDGDGNLGDIQDGYVGQLLSSCSSISGGLFGEPRVFPRVGVQYQAEVPLLVEGYKCSKLVSWSSEITADFEDAFSVGMPICLMWSHMEVGNINGTIEFDDSEESEITLNNVHTELKVEQMYALVCGHIHDSNANSDIQLGSGSKEIEVELVEESGNKLDQVERVLCPMPGSLGESWTGTEGDTFLLALYIFGKNLAVVKRFVESKNMGDILSFYYGQFYGSERYRRWAGGRKLRSKRNITGHKIFSGWRQQELFSRLFSQVSQDCQSMLIEASRTFEEGKTALEEYVFTLKDAVGAGMLVQAVAIGKGKQDLTGTAMEPAKPNNISVRPEIPIGKACSSLSSEEIIKFLTGGFRLSKARSSDLFWEAVWPRLLARGWHSEQPKDHGSFGSKGSLVFLVAGVKKFSRRRLVKGNHYFDSVSDVLNKVASDPGLLELENEAVEGNDQKKDSDLKQGKDYSLIKQRHCYLQPPHLSSNCHTQKFTIVDTSLAYGAERPKVRELRSLPAGNLSGCTSSSLSSESEEDTSEESPGEEQEIKSSGHACLEEVVGGRTCLDSSAGLIMPSEPDLTVACMNNHANPSANFATKKQQIKTVKYQFSRKATSGCTKYLIPLGKQKDLSTVADSTCSTKCVPAERNLHEDASPCTSSSPDASQDVFFQVGSPLDLFSAIALPKESAEGSDEVTIHGNCLGRVESPEKSHYPKLIDLNFPDVSLDSGANEPTIVDTAQKNDVSCVGLSLCIPKSSQHPMPLKVPDAVTSMEQQPTINGRRQSTRSRPLTTKALEAIELGLFNPTKKRKGFYVAEGKPKKKSSRQIHGNISIKENANHSTENDFNDSTMKGFPAGWQSNTDIIGESRV